jgi:hypothetical protein
MSDPLTPAFDGRRPSPIAAPPAPGEIRKLKERLAKWSAQNGQALTDEACELIATSVSNPPVVRAQLNRPNVRPCAGGYLEVIHAQVTIDVLCPDLVNGRVVGATPWAAADTAAGDTLKLWAPDDLAVHPDSLCEVLVRGDSAVDVKRVIEDSAEKTKALNPRMNEKVRRDGILDHLFVQVAHVETLDGFRAAALLSRDGSTRTSFAKSVHAVPAHDAFFGSHRDPGARRARWTEMSRLYQLAAADITEQQLMQLRTFLVPVQIVVGWHPEEGSRATVLDGVDDVVRRTHVETSYPWMPLAQANSTADQALQALHAHELLTRDELRLYGGKLSKDERRAKAMPVEPDEVLADIILMLNAAPTTVAPQPPATQDNLHMVLRKATGAGRITSQFKASIAGPLGLRPFATDNRARQVASATLQEGLRVEALWDASWVNTRRAPAALREAAIAELEEHGTIGPAGRELAAKSLGYLAAQGWLKRETTGRMEGFERDQRAPNIVLERLLGSRHGVLVLAEVLEAGRRGIAARALDAAGDPIEQVSGEPRPLDNEWLRAAFADSPEPEDAAEPLPVAQTPREVAAAKIAKVGALADELTAALKAADSVRDDRGEQLLLRTGWSRMELDPIAEQLADAARRLHLWAALDDRNISMPRPDDEDKQLDLLPEALA